MNLYLFSIGLILIFFIIWQPYIGIALMLILSALQGVISDEFKEGEFFFVAIGGITLLSYAVGLIAGRHKFKIRFSISSLLVLTFTFYLLLSNPGASFNSPERNWVFTYLQLFLLVFLFDNLINDRRDVENLMLLFSLSSIYYFFNIIKALNSGDQSLFIEGANSYARVFVVSALFTYFLVKKHSKVVRTWLIVLLVIQCAGVVLSQSRTGIILLFLCLLYILFKDYRLSFRSLLTIFILGGLFFYFIPNIVTESILKDFSGRDVVRPTDKVDYSSIESNIRYILWGIGYDMWIDSNIFLGIGIGQFKANVVSYLPGLEIGVGLHNTYLSILFETGVFGFLIFMGFIFRAFGIYFNASKREPEIGLATIWFVCYVVILIGGITKHEHYDKILFSMIGMSYFFSGDFLRNAKN